MPVKPSNTQGAGAAIRRVFVAASLAGVLALSACGGGEAFFEVSVAVAGQPVGGGYQSGGAQTITIEAGQSIELDASEPVQWTLQVGGTAITSAGTSVIYQGVVVTMTALSPSRVAIDTASQFSTGGTVPISLAAVSTFDSALVASFNVLIRN